MAELKPENITHAQVNSGAIRCSCESDFFTTVPINVYRDTPTDMFSRIQTLNPDNINVLECISCGKRQLPPLLYQGLSPSDKKLMQYVHDLLSKWNKKHEATQTE